MSTSPDVFVLKFDGPAKYRITVQGLTCIFHKKEGEIF